MACFPKIDQPCPLGIDEQRRIDGYCGRCSKAVHALDAMSDVERIAFVRAAKGPLCVTYRTVARGAALGLGAALALSAPVSRARETPVVGTSAERSSIWQTTPVPAVIEGLSPEQRQDLVDRTEGEIEMITVGGISDPATVEFVDASDALPELPLVHDADPAASR